MSRVRDDSISGSVVILDKVLVVLEEYLSQADRVEIDKLVDGLRTTLESHYSFIVVFHFVNALFNFIEENDKNELESRIILEFIDDYRNSWKDVNERIADLLAKTIRVEDKKILLHSNSSTVQSIFKLWAQDSLEKEVFQTESEPMREGYIQGKLISELGFEVHYIKDSESEKFASTVDVVIFGADAIFENAFLNKSGSAAITSTIINSGGSCFVAADSRKLIGQDQYPGFEVIKKKIDNGSYPFELTLNHQVTKFIFESGVFDPEELGSIQKNVKISNIIKRTL